MKWHIANIYIPIIPICQIGLTNTLYTTYPAHFVNAAYQLLLQSHSKRSRESIEHLHFQGMRRKSIHQTVIAGPGGRHRDS
jgi:hypothetical protein